VLKEHPFPQALAGILRTTKNWSLVPEHGPANGSGHQE